MAHEEMIDIVEPDAELLVKERERIWCLFAKDDGWVGANQALLTATLDPVRVVLGSDTLPHAFCIRESCFDSHCVCHTDALSSQ